MTEQTRSGVVDPNDVKAEFTDLYHAETPHAYLKAMLESEYTIGEAARPYFTAAVELLQTRNSEVLPVQVLDIGCSYGVGAALVQYGCSFQEMTAFFAHRAPTDYTRCVESTRLWLNATAPKLDIRVVGLDVSGEALRFAQDAHMICTGLTTDLESRAPTADDAAWLRGCNLLISCGAIGYVTERTLRQVVPLLGQDHPGSFGPLATFTLLRMFDPEPVVEAFRAHGWSCGRVEGALLPQRAFVDEAERDGVIAQVRQRGLDPDGVESEGRHYANLYAAAPGGGEEYALLQERLRAVAERQ